MNFIIHFFKKLFLWTGTSQKYLSRALHILNVALLLLTYMSFLVLLLFPPHTRCATLPETVPVCTSPGIIIKSVPFHAPPLDDKITGLSNDTISESYWPHLLKHSLFWPLPTIFQWSFIRTSKLCSLLPFFFSLPQPWVPNTHLFSKKKNGTVIFLKYKLVYVILPNK